ncbi:hypothetical protein OQA88_11664 [Cercophora sp. LCS_1]
MVGREGIDHSAPWTTKAKDIVNLQDELLDDLEGDNDYEGLDPGGEAARELESMDDGYRQGVVDRALMALSRNGNGTRSARRSRRSRLIHLDEDQDQDQNEEQDEDQDQDQDQDEDSDEDSGSGTGHSWIYDTFAADKRAMTSVLRKWQAIDFDDPSLKRAEFKKTDKLDGSMPPESRLKSSTERGRLRETDFWELEVSKWWRSQEFVDLAPPSDEEEGHTPNTIETEEQDAMDVTTTD